MFAPGGGGMGRGGMAGHPRRWFGVPLRGHFGGIRVVGNMEFIQTHFIDRSPSGLVGKLHIC